jgi:ADP-heptose:LPS heptosyltransferase
MPPVLDQMPRGSAVAVIRLRSLGDCVLTTPALALLKGHRPDLRVGVIVEDRFAEVFTGNSDVDAVLGPKPSDLLRFRSLLCLNLHGGTRSLALTRLSGAKFRAGFMHFRGGCMYNVGIPRAQRILGEDRVVHTAEHLASAMFYLGVPRQEIPRARLFADPVAAERPYAVLHPFASAPDKTWPAANFIETARALASSGLEPVFLGGPEDDATPFADFRRAIGAPLAETKRLIAGASLFIGNDSGPAHIAAAFGIPLVVLFGPSNRTIWAPWKATAEVLHAIPIEAIAPAQVLQACARLGVAA